MTILHIDSSINGEASASRAICASLVDQMQGPSWGEQVIHRDLAAEPLPHLTLDPFADTRVLDEFLAADTIVIGAPMYNFTLPTPIEGVDRPHRHRRHDLPLHRKRARRPGRGQARDHRARPRRFYGAGSPAAALEHLENYLRGVFNFIGIEPEFVVAEAPTSAPSIATTRSSSARARPWRLGRLTLPAAAVPLPPPKSRRSASPLL